VAIWSGMRREELLGLRFRDVTVLDDGWSILKVRRAVTAAPAAEGGYQIGRTKNERHRQVPLAPAATQVIGQRRLALELELAENDVTGVDVGDAFVFSASFGQHPLRPASVRSWWDALRAVEPELERITFKDLRTTHSLKVNRAVGHRGTVAAHMGHGEDVNRQHYDGRAPGDLDVVRDAIGGLLD
jgi:integrase